MTAVQQAKQDLQDHIESWTAGGPTFKDDEDLSPEMRRELLKAHAGVMKQLDGAYYYRTEEITSDDLTKWAADLMGGDVVLKLAVPTRKDLADIRSDEIIDSVVTQVGEPVTVYVPAGLDTEDVRQEIEADAEALRG